MDSAVLQEEFNKLKPGDRICVKKYGARTYFDHYVISTHLVSDKDVEVRYQSRRIDITPDAPLMARCVIVCRQAGQTVSGKILPKKTIKGLDIFYKVMMPAQFEHLADPLSSKVYADYLEENGYEEAAQFLRKGFPYDT